MIQKADGIGQSATFKTVPTFVAAMEHKEYLRWSMATCLGTQDFKRLQETIQPEGMQVTHTERVSTKHAIALLKRRSWHVDMVVNLKYVFISNLIISHHHVQTWQTLTLVPLNGLFTFFWIHLFVQNWSRKFLPTASWTLFRHSRRRHSGDRRRATGLFCFLAALLTVMATQPAHAGVEPGVLVV